MEFLVISENKLKIMLDASEVAEYGIESENSDYRDPRVRRAFWRILDRACDECGFKVKGEKLLIQYYPSGNGAEIFVTRLTRLAPGIERTLTDSESVTMLSSKNSIYRFENMEEIVRLSREMQRNRVSCRSDLYLSEDGYYYLFFEERSEGNKISPFFVVSEFGEEVPATLELYIKEHSLPILLADAFYSV